MPQQRGELKVPHENIDEHKREDDEKPKKRFGNKVEKDERGIPVINKVEISYPPETPGEYKKVPNRRQDL